MLLLGYCAMFAEIDTNHHDKPFVKLIPSVVASLAKQKDFF